MKVWEQVEALQDLQHMVQLQKIKFTCLTAAIPAYKGTPTTRRGARGLPGPEAYKILDLQSVTPVGKQNMWSFSSNFFCSAAQ